MGYSCGYCGRDYKTPFERGACEVKCDSEIKRQAELNKAKKRKEEKSQRYNSIQEDIKKLTEKIDAYNKDYNINLYAVYNDKTLPFRLFKF